MKKCPKCKADRVIVRSSWLRKTDGTRRRTHACLACGHAFATGEPIACYRAAGRPVRLGGG